MQLARLHQCGYRRYFISVRQPYAVKALLTSCHHPVSQAPDGLHVLLVL